MSSEPEQTEAPKALPKPLVPVNFTLQDVLRARLLDVVVAHSSHGVEVPRFDTTRQIRVAGRGLEVPSERPFDVRA